MILKKAVHKIIFEDIETVVSQNIGWKKLRNKTILISGANGFLSSYLIYVLFYLNDKFQFKIQVLALARNKKRAETRFKKFLKRKDFLLLIQDVCEPIKCKKRIHFIIHAASQASPKYYSIDPVGTLNANVIGTNNLLQLAKKRAVESFLFFSSSEVYGIMNQEKEQISEIDFGYLNPTNIRACYAESKRMGETICVSWMHQYKIPVKIIRPFHTYGPGMYLDDGRVYADFVSDIVNNRNIIMKSDGNAIRAFCYLSDATLAFFTILLNGKNGEAYNVGNPDCEISILNLAEKMVKLFPEKKLKVIKQKSNPNYLKSPILKNIPSIKKINTLGWLPKTNINEGFKRTILSYK